MLHLLLLLLLVCSSQASHFYGTVMTYYPKNTHADGSVTVVVRYKSNSHSCTNEAWTCLSGNCGSESLVTGNIDEESGAWCQTEGISTRLVPSNAPFQLVLAGGNWIDNTKNNIVSWRAVTLVELRKRSDTGQANTSPQTTILPVARVPSNCLRDFNLLAFDPDGDDVRCRYGNDILQECNPCTPPSVLSLSSSCTLSFSPTSSSNEGAYVVQLVMEDFPRQTINLIQTSGSQEVKTTSNAISEIPVQFALKVDPVVPSCTEGLYLPKFLPTTPANRAQLYTSVNQTLEISINAQANNSTISELLFSGPYNINETTLGTGRFILRWTPSESQNGESHPVCFVVQAELNSAKYHSEFRCVIVTVGTERITTTPTKSTTTIPSTTTPQKTTTFSWTTTPQTTTPNDISTTQSSTNVPSTTASATTFSSTTTPQTTTPNNTSTTQSLTIIPSTTASATTFSSTTTPQTTTLNNTSTTQTSTNVSYTTATNLSSTTTPQTTAPNNTSTTQSLTNIPSTTASATTFSSTTTPQTTTLNNTSTTQSSTNVSSTTATNFSSTTTPETTTPNDTPNTQSSTNISSTTTTNFSSTTTPQTTTANNTSTTQTSTNVPSTTASATNFSSTTTPQTTTPNNTSTTQRSTNISSTTATNFSSTTTPQTTTPNNTSTTQTSTNVPSTTASATNFSSTTTPQTTTPNNTSTTQTSTNVSSTTASATNFSSTTAPQTATPNNTSITQSSTSPHSVAAPQDTTLNISNNSVVGLNMRISSSYPLSEDYIRNTVIQQLKDDLVRRGLPSDISLRLVSSMKLEVRKTTAGGSL